MYCMRVLNITSTLTILRHMRYRQIILVPCKATPSSQGDRHWGLQRDHWMTVMTRLHCQALEGQYGSIEAGNLSWELSMAVIRCHHLVSFSVQVREVREVVPFDDIGIFPYFSMMPKCSLCWMHPNLNSLTSTEAKSCFNRNMLRAFCMPFRAMELWTFKSSMKWCEAGSVRYLDVYNSGPFGRRHHFWHPVGKSPLIWVSQWQSSDSRFPGSHTPTRDKQPRPWICLLPRGLVQTSSRIAGVWVFTWKWCRISLLSQEYTQVRIKLPSTVCTPWVPVADLGNGDMERLWYSLSPDGRQALVARVVPVS